MNLILKLKVSKYKDKKFTLINSDISAFPL